MKNKMQPKEIILTETLNHYSITLEELREVNRKPEVVARRFVFANLCHRLLGLSEEKINEYFERTSKGSFYYLINQFDQLVLKHKKDGEYPTKDIQKMMDYSVLYEKLSERLGVNKILVPNRISPVSRKAKFRKTLSQPKEVEAKKVDASTGAKIESHFFWFDCPSCGFPEVREKAKYCEECGSKVKW